MSTRILTNLLGSKNVRELIRIRSIISIINRNEDPLRLGNSAKLLHLYEGY